MPNDTLSQQALAADPTFRNRVKASLALIAFQILTEVGTTPNHQLRKTYALSVIQGLDQATANVVGWLVMRTNLFGATTGTALDQGRVQVTTTATDADLQSQLATDWDILAGV